MRKFCVLAVLGVGAAIVCLTPESADACGRRGYGRGAYGGGGYGYAYASPYYGSAYAGAGYGYYPSTQYLPGMSMYAGPGYPAGGGYDLTQGYGQPMYGQPSAGYQAGYTPATHSVNASDEAFEPRSLTVQPGTIVQFVNRGNHVHTVSDADGRWDSGDIQPGASFTARFQFPGKYNFLCRHHQGMTGTITVSDNVTQPGGAGVGVGPAPGSPPAANRLPNEPLANEDTAFLREAASGGMMEVKLGQLAGERAANADVRRFAERMVNDHTNINRDLTTFAERKGVSIPKEMNKEHQATLDKFKDLRGADFDRTYMKTMVKDHEDDAKAFEKQAKDAKDPDLKALASRVLPFVKNHLTMAREVEGMVKGSSSQPK